MIVGGLGPISLLEFLAVAAMALSGALAAIQRRGNLAAACLAALAAGLVGGTARDLLISAPVFWIAGPLHPAICLAAAGVAWAASAQTWNPRLLPWLDALGFSAYAVVSASIAADAGAAPLSAAVVGVIAGVLGGMVRDRITRRPVMALEPQLYLSAAVVGVVLFVMLRLMQVDAPQAALAGTAAAFALRAGALSLGWAVPGLQAAQDADARPPETATAVPTAGSRPPGETPAETRADAPPLAGQAPAKPEPWKDV